MCVFLALSSCSLLCRSSARVTLSDNQFLHRHRHLSITSGSPVIKRARISIVLHPPLSPSPARHISETRRRPSHFTALSSLARLNDSIIKQERTSTTWILEHLFLVRI
ncbi:uncharacterized protein EDB91DRAFT_1108288, partial [Suillus paluster]|uniref:uncharacterized protein n=1 Tax=Suillus paluster TaxID=48578 RepID=UPI001B87D5FF